MFDILKNPRYLYTNDKHLIELISSNRLNLIASSRNLQKNGPNDAQDKHVTFASDEW
jgi:hypothetical protein